MICPALPLLCLLHLSLPPVQPPGHQTFLGRPPPLCFASFFLLKTTMDRPPSLPFLSLQPELKPMGFSLHLLNLPFPSVSSSPHATRSDWHGCCSCKISQRDPTHFPRHHKGHFITVRAVANIVMGVHCECAGFTEHPLVTG